MAKRVQYAFTKKSEAGWTSTGYFKGLLFLLYDDGSWKQIFEYRWPHYHERKPFNTARLTGKTEGEVIELLEKAYYKGEIQGVFMD